MPVNGQSVGQDYTIGLYDFNTATDVPLGSVQDFKESALKHDIKNMPYNQVPVYGYIPDGYSGTFTIVRTGPALENLHLQIKNNFNNGKSILAGYINQTINESGGAQSRYQYINVVFFLTDSGTVQRDQNIKMTMAWMASDKVLVSA